MNKVISLINKRLKKKGIEEKYGEFIIENVGSSANGLWTVDSDVDLVVQFWGKVKI